jgi:hypothetical protein
MAEQTHIEQMLQTNPRYATMDASTLLMERIAVRSDCVQSCTSRADFSEDDPKPPTHIRKW